MSNSNYSLVVVHNFIQATRDTGYRSTATAVAELLDNALDAGARTIQVFVFEQQIGLEPTIVLAVLDDGSGMDSATLRSALRFGGSDRFNSRAGLGRFGMGLPNSSVSQCRHVDVYTWQKRGTCLSYLSGR